MAYEMRLIDANTIPYEEHYVPDGDTQWQYKKELCVLKPTIDALPTVDAVEVVHGMWKKYLDHFTKRHIGWICSNCSAVSYDLSNGDTTFCPHCGALMDGEA